MCYSPSIRLISINEENGSQVLLLHPLDCKFRNMMLSTLLAMSGHCLSAVTKPDKSECVVPRAK